MQIAQAVSIQFLRCFPGFIRVIFLDPIFFQGSIADQIIRIIHAQRGQIRIEAVSRLFFEQFSQIIRVHMHGGRDILLSYIFCKMPLDVIHGFIDDRRAGRVMAFLAKQV